MLRYLSFSLPFFTIPLIHAQDTSDDTSSQELPPFIITANSLSESISSTATRTAVDTAELPLIINAVPQELINEQQILDPAETLRNISSAQALIGSAGQSNQFTTRGFNTFTYVDGFRIGNSNSPSLGAVNLPVDVSVIDRIEVLKGSSATLFGRGLPGGIVNIITKKPQAEFAGSFSTLVGSDSRFRNVLDLTGPILEDGSLNYRIIGSTETSNSFRDFVESETYTINPSLEWKLSDRSTLLLQANYRKTNNVPDRGVFFLPNLQSDGSLSPQLSPLSTESSFFGERSNRAEFEQAGLTLDFRSEVNALWTTHLVLGARSFEQDSNEVFGDTLDDSRENLIRVREITDSTREDYLVQFDNIFHLSHDLFQTEIDHTLLVGLELQQNRIRPGVQRTGVDQLNLTTGVTQQDITLGGNTFPASDLDQSTDFRLESTDIGIALQDLIKIGDHWNLLLGLRYERSDLDFDLRPFGIVSGVERDEFVFRSGVIYKASDDVSLFANFGEGYVPSLVVTPDQSVFEAQLSEQVEVGLKASLFDNRLEINTSAFAINNDNVLTVVGRSPQGNIIPGTLDQEVNGYEMDFTYRHNDHFSIFGNYSFLDTKVNGLSIGNDNQIGGVPEHSANLWASYHFNDRGQDGLSLGLGIEYRDNTFSTAENALEFPSVFLVNAAISYRKDDWLARINLNNITGRQYFIPNSSVQIGDPGNAISALPGAPFEVRASVTYSF